MLSSFERGNLYDILKKVRDISEQVEDISRQQINKRTTDERTIRLLEDILIVLKDLKNEKKHD